VYVDAPDAVNVTVLPLQIVVLDGVIETEGIVLTFTETVCDLEHVPLAPVTVYVSAATGEAEAVAVVTLPAFALQV